MSPERIILCWSPVATTAADYCHSILSARSFVHCAITGCRSSKRESSLPQ